MEEYKDIVKETYIKNNGEEEWYKEIAYRLRLLKDMKSHIDSIDNWEGMSEEEKRDSFRDGIIDALVEDCGFDEADQLYNVALFEIALDVYEF